MIIIIVFKLIDANIHNKKTTDINKKTLKKDTKRTKKKKRNKNTKEHYEE